MSIPKYLGLNRPQKIEGEHGFKKKNSSRRYGEGVKREKGKEKPGNK